MAVFQGYTVEWEDREGDEREMRVSARSASQAREKALEALRQEPDFVRVLDVELYP